jgi:hypothetical protein
MSNDGRSDGFFFGEERRYSFGCHVTIQGFSMRIVGV